MFKKTNFFKTNLRLLRIIILIIVTLFSILLTILLCNLVLRFLKYENLYSFYDFATNGKSEVYTIDKDLIYRFKNDQLYRNYKALPNSTNANEKTIAMVGDSVTWSYGANDSTSYPITFEKIYNQQHNQNKISVYNYGVPGYGIDQEYILIQNKIRKELKPDLLVWNINVNDIRDSNYMCLYHYQNSQWQRISATYNIGYWYGWLGANIPPSITNSNLFNFVWQRLFRLITSTTNESLYTLGCSTIFRNPSTNKLIAKRLLYSVVELQKQLENTQTQLIVTLVPYQKYFDHQFSLKDLDPDYSLIKNTLNNAGINFIDFNETILNQLQSKTNSPQLNFSQEYFLNNSIDRNPDGLRHPNQKMYDLMAQTLFEYLQENQLTL
ncbi:MAG: hypothetical protein US68_C0012G0038 [Candidatus Shapirobacteria bacterium GW2011_GWE1_38_10]|uniref:SGNH hydrolase-type esterase domain-containing protein n=1 Tax=Candidatus Shapirobacteria bacterium GW2011_GWE1_38_10 TaxID=1618488 RepID=A0A0G0I2V9_9BACT|nr:MAG: hypothetical protein US68_C0012G0038 [Candidatus Shapirobacteria bacterium GW2011_GWE1_38_10]HBP51366.1 hypothetical protein [Candidatus Shapirobacteria bacterium]